MYGLWVGFVVGCFYDLIDELVGECWFGFGFFDLIGVGGDDFIDGFFDCVGVGDLFYVVFFDDFCWIIVFGEDDFEEVFGEFVGDCVVFDEI